MKKTWIVLMAVALISLIRPSVWAFTSGSTGIDGPLNPTTDTEVQLPADGKLNYTTVNIPAGVTVTFERNADNTPVYILATGDVTIAGTISVNGTDGSSIYPGGGGPGGFDGAFGGLIASQGGKGLGPGGGNPGSVAASYIYTGGAGGGGGFGAQGTNGSGNPTQAPGGTGGVTYGNARLLPILGGSGGGGGAGSVNPQNKNTGGAGGGGGGAILIASSGILTVTGAITANGGKGGNGASYAGSGGGGSGGSIKLMANTISGEGAISASGGAGGTGGYAGGAGGHGRIRLEADVVTRSAGTTPPNTYGYPGAVFVANIPTLMIAAVGGINVPENPVGRYGEPDLILPSTTTNPVTVDVAATNIPVGTQVTVTSVPEYGSSNAGNSSLEGTVASSTASVPVALSTEYQCILMATAVFTIQTAMYYDDERIETVRVASTLGGKSETVYITESGREIKASELMAKLNGW
ncbi:MAG: hypothetical protein AB1442_02190 [Nitrospirota bacterium]